MAEFFDPVVGKSKSIQGLRAFAVLSVFIFHLDSEWMPGGFLGVDIFFVISGLLIARMLLQDIDQNGMVRLRHFYARRFYRIVPASLTAALVALPLAYFSLLPGDMKDFSASMVGVVTLSLNKMVANNIGYFSPIAETQPLLHFWSLMVEIHFYLLIPLLFYAIRQRGLLILTILGLMLTSLIYANSLSYWDPRNNYYLLPSRVWELLLGVSLFIYLSSGVQTESHRRLAAWLQPVSIAALCGSLWIFDGSLRHPSLLSVAPLIATVALLWSMLIHPCGIVAKLLSIKCLVVLGNISFSLYLWHYIFIVIFKADTGDLSHLDMIKVVFWTVSSSLVTFFLIERSFQNYSGNYRKQAKYPILLFGGGILVFVFGVHGFFNNGYELDWLQRQSETTKTAYLLTKKASEFDHYDDSTDCMFRIESFDSALNPVIQECSQKFGKGILIIGDSHAIGVWRVARKIAENNTEIAPFVVGVSRGGCKPYKKVPECSFDIFTDQTEYFADHFTQIFYVQAGSSLVHDERPSIDDTDTVVSFLERLAPVIDTIWIGPRIEPNIDPRYFIRLGCDAALLPDLIHGRRLSMLDSFLEQRLSNSLVKYVPSEVLGINQLGDCDRLFWRDSNHWSPSALDALASNEKVQSIFITD